MFIALSAAGGAAFGDAAAGDTGTAAEPDFFLRFLHRVTSLERGGSDFSHILQ